MKIAIFDLDDTLALTKHRLHYIKKTPKDWAGFFAACDKDWAGFFAACDKDRPNPQIIALTQRLNRGHYKVYILTGRSEDVRQQTIDWLRSHQVAYNGLLMRRSADKRPDEVVKKQMFEGVQKHYPEAKLEDFIVFDDRQKVVDMWREIGLVCCQVAKGDF